MKKVIRQVAFTSFAAIVAANIYVIQKPNTSLSALDLDNVETIAEGEPGDFILSADNKLYYPLSAHAYKVTEVVSGTASDNNIPGCPVEEGIWGINTGSDRSSNSNSNSNSNSTVTRIIYCIPCEGSFGVECQNSYFGG